MDFIPSRFFVYRRFRFTIKTAGLPAVLSVKCGIICALQEVINGNIEKVSKGDQGFVLTKLSILDKLNIVYK